MSITLLVASLLALAVPGCDDDRACRQLVQELCAAAEQASQASCDQAEAWLARTMMAPEGELRRLAPDQREIACQAIRDNPEVLERYRDEVRRALSASAQQRQRAYP